MVQTDTLEGVIDDSLWFHYDVNGDVLYLRLASDIDHPTVAEESPEGILILRREHDDRIVGLTIVNWWKRFGHGQLPDSIRMLESELEARVDAWRRTLAA